MSMWRPLFLQCMILDHKLQRMLNDSKTAQLNFERPFHQTAVGALSSKSCVNSPCIIWMESPHHWKMVDILPVLVFCGAKLHGHWPRPGWISGKYLGKMNSILTIFCILLLLAPASKMMHWEFGCNGRRIFSKRTLHSRLYVAFDRIRSPIAVLFSSWS